VGRKLNFNFKSILYFLGAICIAMFVKYLLVSSPTPPITDEQYKKLRTIDSVQYLINFADSATKKCPIRIDSITTLLGVQSWGKTNLKFRYSLNIDTSKYVFSQLKANISKYLLNLIKTDLDFKLVRDWNIIVVYNYFTPDGKSLFDLEFKPEQYKL
jgi:hypothetical protein